MKFEWKILRGSFNEVAFEQVLHRLGGRDGGRGFLAEGTVWTKVKSVRVHSAH